MKAETKCKGCGTSKLGEFTELSRFFDPPVCRKCMKKALVVFLGYQERVDGTSFLLVNEIESHSTVKYDEDKHELVDEGKQGGE